MSVSIEDFAKLELVVGTIVEAQDHPKADRLLVLKVDVGESQPRQLVAGIKARYRACELPGRQIIVIKNLEPATIRGIESQGMLLAASDEAGNLALLTPDVPMRAGSRVR